MTKAQRILELYDGKRTTREIAEIVGCLPEYVRVVARQRKGSGLWEMGNRVRARRASRQAYAAAIKSGLSRYEAYGHAGQAYSAEMLRSARRARQGAPL